MKAPDITLHASGRLIVKKRRPNRIQRAINRWLVRLPREISRGYQLRGRLMETVGPVPNLILNGALTTGGSFSAMSGSNPITFYATTSSDPNYEDLDGTWNQSGNTVTRASGSGTFPTSPSQIGNELKWEDGERCHVTARASDTSITVSGPSRTITGKTIRRYNTNFSSTTNAQNKASTSNPSPVTDLAVGIQTRTRGVIFDAASAPYTLRAVVIGGSTARIVLPVPVEVEEFDQLEMSYTVQLSVSGRETHEIVLSDAIAGWPVEYPALDVTGDGSEIAITAEDHHFLEDDEVVIKNAIPLRHAITTISSDGTEWTVTAPSHGLSPSDTCVIEGCSVTGYNGTHTVASAPDADTITILNVTSPGAASDGTVRLATPGTYFNGTYTVTSVPDSDTVVVAGSVTGPPVDPSTVLTSPDKAYRTIFGAVFETNSDAQINRAAWTEPNQRTTPAVDRTTDLGGTTAHGDATSTTNISGTAIQSSYTNDFTYSVAYASTQSWSAGGSSQLRVKDIQIGRRAVTSGHRQFIKLHTAQPKLDSHRFQYPTWHQKITRELL